MKLERKARFKNAVKRIIKPSSFKDNFGNTISPIELVFPILRLREDRQYDTVGTGFFIHPAGGFITAKHCLYSGDIYDHNCYAIHSVGSGQHFIRKIQYFEAHPTGDIGVGMLKGQLKDSRTNEIILKASFPVSLTLPTVNDEVTTLAYPRMKINKNQVGTFPCDKYAGKILSHLPNGSGWLKSECFITNMEIKSGASGGPVLRGNHIIGVNSTSMDIPDNEDPISFITPIQQIFDLKLKDGVGEITTVKELMESGHMAWVK